MSISGSHLEQRLADLKKSFDTTFALPHPSAGVDLIQMVLIVAGGQRYAIRLRQLSGLEANLKIVPVPAELPGLLGLSAVRGHLVPVFDLASLLGAGSHSQAPRWVALHEGKELLGLAFDEFEGTEGVPIGVLDAQDSPPGQEAQAIRVRSGLVHLVDLPAVISRISEKKRD